MGRATMLLHTKDGTPFYVQKTFKNLTGMRIGRLVVGEIISFDNGYKYDCRCDCGNTCVVNKRELLCKDTKSCGCLKEDFSKSDENVFVKKYKTHGWSGTREHQAWKHIKARTCNPNNLEYPIYSLLGMQENWKTDFLKFLNHIGPVPDKRPRWSVGRIDNTKGYFEGNIRWERDDQQSKNKGMYSSNKSGKTGVHYTVMPKSFTAYWVATWRTLDGKPKAKNFSIKKYGDELAFFLTCEKRDLEMLKLKLLGVEYGEFHGLSKENKEK